ncbi:Replication protein C C-terminal region, partial [Pseudovibrio axinellae]|uniref:replication initiation protein RepC n=2 Tax=Pseudovibrio axinellae TaxID=989403 RepID=UPI0008C28BB5
LLERFEQSAAAKDQQRGLGAPSVPHLGVEIGGNEDPQNTVGRKKTSGRPELDFRHINTNYTNQTLSNERRNKRALPYGNDLNSPLSATAQMALERSKPESADRARQHLHGVEGRSDAPALPQTNPPSAQAAFLNSGIEHITLKQILACSSPMLREMISNASKAGGSDWTALIKAAKLAASFLGISTPAWQEACDKLGASAAATIIVIAERRSTDPTTPINSYGGFVRGCLAKAETGNLHLHKSVFGLLAKGNLDE